MSIYMSRAFRASNSSFRLQSGTALQSEVLRLRDKTFLVDTGVGAPRICTQDEATITPTDKTRFESKVGYMGVVSGETSLIRKQMLERYFIDLVAGDSVNKERSISSFNELVGSADGVPGEQNLLLPRKFRQDRAWMELRKKWSKNSKVKGFVVGRTKRGYSVAIAGFVAFLRFKKDLRIASDRYIIDRFNPKTREVEVIQQGARFDNRQVPSFSFSNSRANLSLTKQAPSLTNIL